LAPIGTTKKAPLAAALTGIGTTETTFKKDSDSTAAAVVYIPPKQAFGEVGLKSCRFRVVARGRMTGGTTTNFTPILQYGTSATAASNTDVAALTARACDSTSGHWVIVAEFTWDATSLLLNGNFRGANGSAGTLNTDTITTQVTAVDLSNENLGFCVTADWSADNASNAAYLDELSLEVL
jgi:hypothetical protein